MPLTRPPHARILVVDDNEDAANSLATLLEVMGYEVRTAYDGPEAIAAADEFNPAVALLDIGLPGMDGYEVAARLRPMLGNEAVLVALTGYGQEEDRQRAFAAGFDLHLVKPTSVEALHELLSALSTPWSRRE